MKVLVTGAAGFIGGHLVDRMRNAGWQVLATDVTGGDDIVVCSVLGQTRRLDRLARQFGPDAVVHLAGQADIARSITDPAWDVELNVLGTVNAYQAAAAAGASVFVFPSSWAVYDPAAALPWRPETTPRFAANAYGASKTAAADLLRVMSAQGGPAPAVAVLGNVYGPGVESVIWSIAESIENRGPDDIGPIVVGAGVARDFVWIGDVCSALMAACEARTAATANVASGVTTTLEDLAEAMVAAAGSKVPVIVSYEATPGVVGRVELDVTGAFEAWGWRPATHVEQITVRLADLVMGRLDPAALALR